MALRDHENPSLVGTTTIGLGGRGGKQVSSEVHGMPYQTTTHHLPELDVQLERAGDAVSGIKKKDRLTAWVLYLEATSISTLQWCPW